jgi:glycosyltransferase involved in cell wall biosynthesis
VPENHDSGSVTVAIVTRDRKAELRTALQSVLAQETVGEVIVVDDGSTDGTSEMVREDFPTVRLHRYEPSVGPSASRNRATDLAGGDVVVYLDDDAYFPSTATVAQTLADFDDPRVGIVAIPFADLVDGELIERHRRPPDDDLWVLPTFVGAAYAARRDVFTRAGGFGSEYRLTGEERDLSLRLLAAGYVTRMGRADPAVHVPSPVRSLERMDTLGRRNEIVWAWSSFPAPWHLVYLVGYAIKGIYVGIRVRRPGRMIRGLVVGLRAIPSVHRAPVPRQVFAMDRRLRKRTALRLSEIEPDLGAT